MSLAGPRFHAAGRHRRAMRANGAIAAAGQGVVTAIVTLAIGVLFMVSAMLLFNFGINYEAAGGSLFEKVHPGSWLVFLAFALSMFAGGEPARHLDGIVARQPGLSVFFVTWLVLLAQAVLVQKAPFTPLIDTFLMPMALLVLLRATGDAGKRRIAMLIHAFYAANALLGLYEFLSGYRLTPYVAGTLLVEADWRSTAFFGHPLANAILTGSYVVAICAGGARELPPVLRPAMVGLQMAAMIAFGGRSSLVTMLLFVAVAAAAQTTRFIGGARLRLPAAALVALALPLAIGALALAFDSGFFDKLLLRFADDNGSAKARLIMIHLFDVIPLPDLLLGPDQNWIGSLQRLEGIEYGLESFWLATILTYGAIVAVIFFAGLFAFCRDLVAGSKSGSFQVLLFFFIVASTSVSLSAKTPVFGLIVAIMLVLLRPACKAATTQG